MNVKEKLPETFLLLAFVKKRKMKLNLAYDPSVLQPVFHSSHSSKLGGAKSLGDLRPPYRQCFFLLSRKDQNEWKNENVKLKEKKLSKQ